MIIKQRSLFSFILVSALSLINAFSFAGEAAGELVIQGTSVQAPLALGALSVMHNQNGFSVLKNGETSEVQTHCLDKSLRGISQSKLKGLLKSNGYLRVNQASDGQYLLEADGRLNGGGWIAGAIAGGLTRVAGYGIAVGIALLSAKAEADSGRDPRPNVKGGLILGSAAIAAIESTANGAQTAVTGLTWWWLP